jgi:hypothetical protein
MTPSAASEDEVLQTSKKELVVERKEIQTESQRILKKCRKLSVSNNQLEAEASVVVKRSSVVLQIREKGDAEAASTSEGAVAEDTNESRRKRRENRLSAVIGKYIR